MSIKEKLRDEIPEFVGRCQSQLKDKQMFKLGNKGNFESVDGKRKCSDTLNSFTDTDIKPD